MTNTQVEVPDMLGGGGTAKVVAAFIADIQGQIKTLECMQVANQAQDHDPMPGPGDPVSYGEKRRSLEAGIAEVCEHFSGVMDEVRALAPQPDK